jgi:hypothetical protein
VFRFAPLSIEAQPARLLFPSDSKRGHTATYNVISCRERPVEAASDPDGVDGLHYGCGAARTIDRRRRRNAFGQGHCGVRRHDQGEGVSIFLTPIFYVVVRRLAGNRPLKQSGQPTVAAPGLLAPAEGTGD